jgi:hypothetical protein
VIARCGYLLAVAVVSLAAWCVVAMVVVEVADGRLDVGI